MPVVGLWEELRVLWQQLAVLVKVVVLEVDVFRSCWLSVVAVEKTPCWGSFGCVGTTVGWIQLVLR